MGSAILVIVSAMMNTDLQTALKVCCVECLCSRRVTALRSAGRQLHIGAGWLESNVDVRQWQFFYVNLEELNLMSNDVRVEMLNADGGASDADVYIGVKGQYPTLRSYEARDITHSPIDSTGNRANAQVHLQTSVSDQRPFLRIGVYGFCCSANDQFKIRVIKSGSSSGMIGA
jgi:hypothetical protein